MRYIRYSVILVGILIALPAFCQVQKGYVKSLGRPDKKGEAISSVSVRVKGEHNPVLSQQDGTFSMLMTGKRNGDAYSLQEVKKKGYELNESGVIGRQYAFSDKVPLTIVMVSSAQLQADKQRIENNAFRVAEKNYKSKLELLEKQKAESTITEDQYRKELLDLQDKFEKYQLLIDGLAEHYAHVDYDELNDKEQEINICIENGELERADSLIRTLFDPIDVLKRNKEALAQLNQQISEANSIIDMANEDMLAVLKQQEKDANYLYQLYTIALSRFDLDNARNYITTRAELDSTNVQWGLDAAHFIGASVGDLPLAERLTERALCHSLLQYGELHELTIACYDNLFMSNMNDRVPIAQKALDLSIKLYGSDSHIATASQFNNLGMAYLITDSLDLAIKYVQKSIDIYQKEDLENRNLSSSYSNIAGAYAAKHDYIEAIKCAYKSISIRERQEDMNVHGTYYSLASIYNKIEQYDSAVVYYKKAIDIEKKIFVKSHHQLVESYSGISSVYFELGDYNKSQEYLNFALESLIVPESITDSIRGLKLAETYESLAIVYRTRKEYIQAIDFLKKSMDIKKMFLDEKHKDLLQSYTEIGYCYYCLGDYKQALMLLKERLRIINNHYLNEESIVAQTYSNIANIYIESNELDSARWYIEESLYLCKNKKVDCNDNYPCLLNAGAYYAKTGDLNKAIDLLMDAMKLSDSVSIPDKKSLNPAIAKIYSELEDWDNAIFYYKKELSIESIDSITRAELLYYVGLCYCHKGEEEEALNCLLNAVDIFKKKAPNNELLADACNNVALIYLQFENVKEAKTYGLQAIRYGQCDLIEDNPELADYYYNMGLISARSEEYEDALDFFRVAKQHFEHLYGENSLKKAETIQNVAAVYNDMGNEMGFIVQLSDALNIFLTLVMEDPDRIIPYIQKIEEIIVVKSINTIHQEYENMLITILNRFQEMDKVKYSPNVLLVMNDLGNLYYSQKRFEESINMYSSIIDLSTEENMVALMQVNLANVYLEMELFIESEQMYVSALKFFLQENKPGSIEYDQYIGMSYDNLAYICYLTKRYDEELDYYLHAEPYLEKTGSQNLGRLYDNISKCYKEKGNYSKAAEYNKKSFYLLLSE